MNPRPKSYVNQFKFTQQNKIKTLIESQKASETITIKRKG